MKQYMLWDPDTREYYIPTRYIYLPDPTAKMLAEDFSLTPITVSDDAIFQYLNLEGSQPINPNTAPDVVHTATDDYYNWYIDPTRRITIRQSLIGSERTINLQMYNPETGTWFASGGTILINPSVYDPNTADLYVHWDKHYATNGPYPGKTLYGRIIIAIHYHTGGWYINNLISTQMLDNWFSGIKTADLPDSTADTAIGNQDNSSDPIPFPELPGIDILDTGILRAYKMTANDLSDLADVLWSPGFIEAIKSFFTSPSEAIVSLHVIPYAPDISGQAAVKIGNFTSSIIADRISNQYKIIDFGQIELAEYFGGYQDYKTRVSLYLPFIGNQELNAVDVMGAKIRLRYYVDCVSGVTTAMLKIVKRNTDSVLYSWSGSTTMSIPLSATNYTEKAKGLVSGVLGIAAGIAGTVATGGAAAPAVIAGIAGVGGMAASQTTHYTRVSNVSGDPSFIGVLQPYLTITRPRMAKAESYNNNLGRPSFITSTIGTMSGLTQIQAIHIENINATDSERSEIDSLLKEGVII